MIAKHEISPEVFEEALKRHEDKFEKELAEVDIRAVVLKTKKALIEQSMKNNAAYNAALDYDASMKIFKQDVDYLKLKMDGLKREMEKNRLAFEGAIALLSKEQEKAEDKNKGFFKGFWEFLKCLMK